MKSPDGLRWANFSDVHLGHGKTPASFIVSNLMLALPDNETTAKLDIITLAGDVFDQDLGLWEDCSFDIQVFITYLLNLCKKHDIVLRVLEGTPSHDWKQSRLFVHINEHANIGADVKYFDTLDIEHIDKFDIDVLYIPDEYRPTCEQTWAEVKNTLALRGLEQVDYVVMHGAFPHQMPEYVHNRLDLHNPENYLSITRKYIFVGHVHFHSQYKRILASGSFDRLKHGEEGAKGHLRLTIRTNGFDDILFVENKPAMKYITVNCEKLEAEQVIDRVHRAVNKLPDRSYLSIKCRRDDVAKGMMGDLIKKYQHRGFIWTMTETGKKSAENNIVMSDNRDQIQTIHLGPDNLVSLLMDRIMAKHPVKADRCRALLMGVMNE